MAVYGFGSGSVFAVRTDVTNALPIQIGALQDVSVDFSFDIKELHGQFQFPLDTARANGKVTGKASTAKLDVETYNQLFFGQTSASGGDTVVIDEAGTVPASSTYVITVANAATWTTDEGVYYKATGLKLTPVTSLTAAGQYTVAAGVYTFYSGDASAKVKLSYKRTLTTGKSIVIANQLLGVTPTLAVTLTNQYRGNNWTLELNAVTPSKWTFPQKLADYMIADWEFSAFADSAGNIGTLSVSE